LQQISYSSCRNLWRLHEQFAKLLAQMQLAQLEEENWAYCSPCVCTLERFLCLSLRFGGSSYIAPLPQ
jgi:hypothetical protein